LKVLKKYRLELHWDSVSYDTDEVASLKGAYFTGPVLKEAARINDEDQLIMDMTKQHAILPAMEDYYQALLKWRGVEYKEDCVYLKEASMQGKYVNSLERLENDDWILIDCREHESEKHPYLLVYWSEVHTKDQGAKY
jgi:hypothetical protein